MAPKPTDEILALMKSELAAQRDETRKLFENQATKQDSMLETIQSAVAQMQIDRASDMKKIEERIERTDLAWQKAIDAIKAEISRAPSLPTTKAGDPFVQNNKRPRGADDPPPTPAGFEADPGRDVTRVWLVNFPKPMPASKLEKIAKTNIDKHVPHHEATKAKIVALNFKQRVSISFSSKEAARNFLVNYSSNPDKYSSSDGVDHVIHAKPDRSYDSRTIGKATGVLWRRIHTALTESGKMEPRFKLGTTGIKGQLYIQDDDNIWELFSTSISGSAVSVAPNLTNLSLWGVDAAMKDDMIREANEAAAERWADARS